MKITIQLACDPNASIQSILTSATNGMSMMGGGRDGNEPGATLLSSPENTNLYFSALIANQPPLSNPSGIVGLLLLPCSCMSIQVDAMDANRMMAMKREGGSNDCNSNGNVGGSSYVSPGICKSYLIAVAARIDSVLNEWNANRLDARYLTDLLKVSCISSC